MVLTFWGCSKSTAFFIGDETSQPKGIRAGLEAVNYLLLVGATILAAYSFMLLFQIFHDFTITVALTMGFIVMFVTAVAVVYKLWQICNSKEEHFTLKVQGTWTKVSRGSWVKLRDQDITQAMLTSDYYIHDRNRFGRYGVMLHSLRYITSVVQNPGGRSDPASSRGRCICGMKPRARTPTAARARTPRGRPRECPPP